MKGKKVVGTTSSEGFIIIIIIIIMTSRNIATLDCGLAARRKPRPWPDSQSDYYIEITIGLYTKYTN